MPRRKTFRNGNLPDLSYNVGYKRPPMHSRFKKGQSGNKNGRPTGSSTWREIFKAELERPMTLTIDGQEATMTVLDALLADAAQRAANGSIPHTLLLMRDEYDERESALRVVSFDWKA